MVVEAGVDQAIGRAAAFRRRVLVSIDPEVADPNVSPARRSFSRTPWRPAPPGAPTCASRSRAATRGPGMATSRSDGCASGPDTGGLFLEDEIAELGSGEEFVPDHDQRIVSAGVALDTCALRPSVSLSVRHESGTPIERDEDAEEELADSPGAEMVDFAKGRVKARTLASLPATCPSVTRGRDRELQVSVTNNLSMPVTPTTSAIRSAARIRRAANPFGRGATGVLTQHG